MITQAGVVVIAQRQTDISLAHRLLILVHVALQESGDVAFSLCIEVAVSLAHAVEDAPTLLLEQVVVAVEPMEEVHVEAVVECIGRIRPLRHHEAFGILLLQQLANLAPEELRLVLVGVEELLVAPHTSRLHQRTGHVGTESVGTHVHPEAQHVLQVFAHRQHIGMIGRQLPRLVGVRIRETKVQRRLTPVEVAHELSVASAVTFDELSSKLAWWIHPVGLRPDVVVRILILLLLLRLHEPWVVDGRIADDVVENDMHATLVHFLKQPPRIVVGAIAGGNLVVVANVVARIHEGRVEEWIEPNGIDAEALHIVEFADDALQVADAVAVRITERLRINLIEHRILCPLGHLRYFILTGNRLC